MRLRYIGKTGARRVNGRRMVNGMEITNPQEVKDLATLPDFEEIKAEPKDKPKVSKPKGTE